jgi:addiction module RelE/StbE family toxin
MKKLNGTSAYFIEFKESVIKSDIPQLSKSAKDLVTKAIRERLMVDPVSFGKPLRYNFKGYRRLRVSNYRIIYRIDEENHKVIITDINHRKDSYDE